MAQQKHRIDLKARQLVAAEDIFNNQYKRFIITEFVNKFGSSYKSVNDYFVIDNQTGKIIKDTWRKDFDYSIDRETLLLEQSRVFFGLLPVDNSIYETPGFLKILASKIAEYLSSFIAKKEPNTNNRNKYTEQLIKYLYFDHQYVQNKANRITKANQRSWGLKQKAKREKEERKHKAEQKKPYTPSVCVSVDISLGTAEYSKHVQNKLHRMRTYLSYIR
jgi:hypothetical protein